MIRNKSDIFTVDQDINRKKNGKLWQQCSIPPFFCLIPRSTEKKTTLDLFLKSIRILLVFDFDHI